MVARAGILCSALLEIAARVLEVVRLSGLSVHRELELFTLAGISPAEALASATARTAETFGLQDRGQIAPGLRADLLLVRGDPTTNIVATRDIVRVSRGGVEFNRRVGL